MKIEVDLTNILRFFLTPLKGVRMFPRFFVYPDQLDFQVVFVLGRSFSLGTGGVSGWMGFGWFPRGLFWGEIGWLVKYQHLARSILGCPAGSYRVVTSNDR